MGAEISKRQRRGAATVEVAIVLPLLLMLSLGAIRYGWLFLKAQQITNAARNGARTAITPDSTLASVQAQINNLITLGGMDPADCTISVTTSALSGDFTSAEVGDSVTVLVTIPHESVDIIPVPFVSELEPDGWKLGAEVTMAKEGF